MKKASKIITMLIIILMITSIGITVFAGSRPADLVGSMQPTNFGGEDSKALTDLIKNIVRVINIVGVGIAVIILLVLGIKYMMGSAEEKADYKKSMIPYLVGAILIFAGTSIVNVVVQLASSFTETGDNAPQ